MKVWAYKILNNYAIYPCPMQEFKKAAADIRNLDKTPSNEDYAKMYGLYKQATAGDCDRGQFYIIVQDNYVFLRAKQSITS